MWLREVLLLAQSWSPIFMQFKPTAGRKPSYCNEILVWYGQCLLPPNLSVYQKVGELDVIRLCMAWWLWTISSLSVYSCFLSEEGCGMDRVTLAQLTQLYMTVKLECPFYDVCIIFPCIVCPPKQGTEFNVWCLLCVFVNVYDCRVHRFYPSCEWRISCFQGVRWRPRWTLTCITLWRLALWICWGLDLTLPPES